MPGPKPVKRGHPCQICGTDHLYSQAVQGDAIAPGVLALIRQEHPDFQTEGYICRPHLDLYRDSHVRRILEDEKGSLDALEKDVLRSIRDQDVLSENTDAVFDEKLSFGDRLSDVIADFGGSWRFIIFFLSVMVIWISINIVSVLKHPFDPYPFILLNLVLSCIAALQAPVIMMSQNRQEARDRMRAQSDYKVNLKAELEIRHLHEKVDHLLMHQWQRLMEVQQIQIELMNEINQRSRRPE
ncbi:MAG: DUF1003 domain-containing protein [Rhizobiales bacterium]|nr:DUF1003 domain-containing protein [Hyphomicrobiales bacterium]